MIDKLGAYHRKTSAERRQDLIKAGIECLGEGGISNFTINKICKEAKVSRGLVNHHFKSKDDLLLCIYDQMTTYLVDVDSTLSPEATIVWMIDECFDGSTTDRPNLRAWLAIWGEVATHSTLLELHDTRYGRYTDLLSGALSEIAQKNNSKVNVASKTRQLIALIDGLWLKCCLHPDSYSMELAHQDCLSFFSGFLDDIEAGKN